MKVSFTAPSFWLMTLPCLGLAVTEAHAAEFVEISAEIESLAYQLGDTNEASKAKPITFSVVCVTGTNEWRIENTYLEILQGVEDHWMFDGTNVYNRSHKTPRAQKSQARTGSTNDIVAPIENGPFTPGIKVWQSRDGLPLGHAGVNLPWLAFCSGNFLKREGRIVPLAAALLSNTRDRFGYADVTTTFDDGFGLPRTIELFTSKALLESSENEFDEHAFLGDRYADWKKKIVANLQEGQLMFHYAVLESTNLLGRNFPLRFEFFQNGRSYQQAGNWFCHGMGKVTSIRASERPETLLVAGVEQRVTDLRFRDPKARVRSILYNSTNAFLAPTNAPELQSLWKEELDKRR
jgi:hypothetical protein